MSSHLEGLNHDPGNAVVNPSVCNRLDYDYPDVGQDYFAVIDSLALVILALRVTVEYLL